MDATHEQRFIQTNGVTLHTVLAGPEQGAPVILLHGFPEFWYGWRKQIEPLATAGYRVAAPDQRGYNLSDKPAGVRAYRLDELAADIVGLMDALGCLRASIVGHDWGGAVAWWLALRYPQRVARVAILNVAHPAVVRRFLLRDPKQMRRSWYVLFFQVPKLPEALMRLGGGRRMFASLRRTGREGAFSDEDEGPYCEAWGQPGALTAMVNWYRAMLRPPPRLDEPRVQVPTLLVWGAQDRYLRAEMARPSIELCEDGRLEMIAEATHWVQHEEAPRVNGLLVEFLAAER